MARRPKGAKMGRPANYKTGQMGVYGVRLPEAARRALIGHGCAARIRTLIFEYLEQAFPKDGPYRVPGAGELGGLTTFEYTVVPTNEGEAFFND